MSMTTEEKKLRGFAALSPEERREISRLGGLAARNRHTWTTEEAQAAGRKGGKATQQARRDAERDIARG